ARGVVGRRRVRRDPARRPVLGHRRRPPPAGRAAAPSPVRRCRPGRTAGAPARCAVAAARAARAPALCHLFGTQGRERGTDRRLPRPHAGCAAGGAGRLVRPRGRRRPPAPARRRGHGRLLLRPAAARGGVTTGARGAAARTIRCVSPTRRARDGRMPQMRRQDSPACAGAPGRGDRAGEAGGCRGCRAMTGAARKPRVLHFVTGGFPSGSIQVAIQLVNAGRASGRADPLLVLRRKSGTTPERVAELEAAGTPVRVVAGWSHLATVAALVRLCRDVQPDILVAHGFSEHLWGRYAGLLAKVPHLVHVEHNSRERYTRWRRAQTRWLAARTSRIVGCSEGVRQVLLAMGMPPGRTLAIPNGIRIEPFTASAPVPASQRVPGIVMASRLSRQKDHATLLRALAVLRERGLTPPVLLAGHGKPRYRRPLEQLCTALGLDGQVRFLGLCRNVPELLLGHRIS